MAILLSQVMGDRGNTFRITADDRTNALVIQASPTDVRTIQELIDKLDSLAPATGSKR